MEGFVTLTVYVHTERGTRIGLQLKQNQEGSFSKLLCFARVSQKIKCYACLFVLLLEVKLMPNILCGVVKELK